MERVLRYLVLAILAGLAGIPVLQARLRAKEEELATIREQIQRLTDRVRKMDDIQAAYHETLTRYNALVAENAANEQALRELTETFEREMGELEAAFVENTDYEEGEVDDGGDDTGGDDTGGGGFEPSGNQPAAARRGGAKKSGAKKGR